jgi:apolipoprotein D and lipocalin family protein
MTVKIVEKGTKMFALAGIFALALVPGIGPAAGHQDDDRPTTVEHVDLDRYVGLWYEIAKIPNRFQKKCAVGTTAYYSLKDDGKISVVNRCIDGEGKVVRATGLAKVEDAQSNAKLKVSFVRVVGVSLFWGDYWIIGLAEDYRYAVVGTAKRNYGWILARQPELSAADLAEVHAILRRQGYDPETFVMSLHDSAGP